MSTTFTGLRRIAVLIAASAIGSALILAPSGTALADVPPTAVGEFLAPTCAGSTADNLTDATGQVPVLTRVFGQRLSDYNAGHIVMLYDSSGDNREDGGYPPMCGVRYVSGVGPVSQWMFCTDLWSHACNWTGAGGELVDKNGDPLGQLETRSTNTKLKGNQEKLIAYLVRNGHSYEDVPGGLEYGVTHAQADGDSSQRIALQALVWCVTDYGSGFAELDATCDSVLDSAEQTRLLALIPDTPTIELSLSSTEGQLDVGDTATFTLRTNLYGQPINLAATGAAGSLVVASGPATLDNGTITVAGNDPTVTTAVTLGYTATAAGNLQLDASSAPVSVTDLSWNQSPGFFSGDGVACQVFAAFESTQLDTLADRAIVQFAATLPDTGVEATGPAAVGLVLALAGAAMLILGRRRARLAMDRPPNRQARQR